MSQRVTTTTDYSERHPDAGRLYPALLGEAWSALADEVRRMHMEGSAVTARGRMRVERGRSRLVRLAAALAGLPRPSDAARIDLMIEATADGELWLRTFDGQPMSTRQFRSGNLLAERMGAMEILFRLEAVDGALHYRQISTALVLAGLRIPLPRALAPSVEATERAASRGRTAVHVEIRLPLLGRFLSYDGELERL